MSAEQAYENFPLRLVLVCGAVSLGLYLAGAFVLFRLGLLWGSAYILLCLSQEIRQMRAGCVNCYYYGKFCGLGRGKIAGWLFQRGDPRKFAARDLAWKDLLPDLSVSLIPFLAGIYLLILSFNWAVFWAVTALFVLTTSGNAYIRGNIACRYCKQRKLGCPAEKLFKKK